MKYIIDTDPGIDDAIAIIMGYLNKLDIIGFTLVEGNIDIQNSENNLKIIEDILNSNIKIYKSNKKKEKTEKATYAHGKNGLGDVILTKSKRKTETMSAEDFIIESAYKNENNLTLICFGPLTNIAKAIQKDKNITSKISKIVFMGISYDEKPYHEFNLSIDPLSAQIVLNSDIKQINIITHEIGIKTYIEKDYIDSLKQSNTKISNFVNQIAQKYMEFSLQNYNINGLTAPDPVTMASVINPKIITLKPCRVTVDLKDKGLSKVELTENSNILIATDVNVEEFTKLFKQTFN